MSKFKNVFTNYTPQKAVSWLSASILINTLLKENKAKKIDDRREESRAFELRFTDFSKVKRESEDIYLDFIADTGDGFNETITVMYKCMGDLTLNNETIPAGEILLCGGDQVYPFATSQEYANRFFGPFMTAQSLALETEEQKKSKRYLHAIPGNHDWYGGLYAFQEYFCSNRQYGNYSIKQPTSYHAIRLTKNLWVWMLDIQLAENFNTEQIKYFSDLCSQKEYLPEKNEHWQIILCIAQPFWFQKSVDPEDKLYTMVDNFVTQLFINQNPKQFVSPKGKKLRRFLELKVILTGDIHHYTRFNLKYNDLINNVDDKVYKNTKPITKPLALITAGGGGAYTYPTHHMEDKVKNRAFQSKVNNASINMDHYYPDSVSSIRLRHHCLWNIFWKNASFALFPFAMYLFSFLLFAGYLPPFTEVVKSIKLSYIAFMICFYLFGNTAFYYLLAQTLDKYFKYMPYYHKYPWYGLVALFSVINLCMFLLAYNWQKSVVDSHIGELTLETLSFYLIVSLISILNTYFFGLYIYLSNVFFKLHDNEIFSISKINKFKNFLRIKIDKDNITIYPIGIDNINNSLKTSFEQCDFPKLKKGLDETVVQLIEPPIKISLSP